MPARSSYTMKIRRNLTYTKSFSYEGQINFVGKEIYFRIRERDSSVVLFEVGSDAPTPGGSYISITAPSFSDGRTGGEFALVITDEDTLSFWEFSTARAYLTAEYDGLKIGIADLKVKILDA